MSVENDSRHKHRRKQVGRQTKCQGDCKALHRTAAEKEQNGRRDDGRDVSVDDRDPCMSKALIHRCRWSLACPHFFADTLKNQHIRVHAHTDGQDDSCNSRQRQRRPREAHEPQQNHQVQDQRQIGIDARTRGSTPA